MFEIYEGRFLFYTWKVISNLNTSKCILIYLKYLTLNNHALLGIWVLNGTHFFVFNQVFIRWLEGLIDLWIVFYVQGQFLKSFKNLAFLCQHENALKRYILWPNIGQFVAHLAVFYIPFRQFPSQICLTKLNIEKNNNFWHFLLIFSRS